MRRLTKRSKGQLALGLEREVPHELTAEQHSALMLALADLLLEALGEAPSASTNGPGDNHEF